jgi:zinc transporter ZupT
MEYIVLILSVLVGAVIATYFKGLDNNKTKLLISFSGAYLFAITIIHLIPELYHGDGHHSHSIGIFILMGFFIQIILENFTQGIEHGHGHFHGSISLSMLIGLSIHSFMEGIPLGGHHNHGVHENLLAGIALHKIPVSIILMNMFIMSNFSKKKSILFIVLFAMMTPLGTLISNNSNIFLHYHAEVMAIVIGIFLHISTTILFESSEGHKFNRQKTISIIIGTGIALLGFFL